MVPWPWLRVGLGKGITVLVSGLGECEVPPDVLLEEVVSVVKVVGGLSVVKTTVVVYNIRVLGDLVVVVKGLLTADKAETF